MPIAVANAKSSPQSSQDTAEGVSSVTAPSLAAASTKKRGRAREENGEQSSSSEEGGVEVSMANPSVVQVHGSTGAAAPQPRHCCLPATCIGDFVTIVNELEGTASDSVWNTFVTAAGQLPKSGGISSSQALPTGMTAGTRVAATAPASVSVNAATVRPRPPQRAQRSTSQTAGRNPWPPQAVAVLKDWLFKVVISSLCAENHGWITVVCGTELHKAVPNQGAAS